MIILLLFNLFITQTTTVSVSKPSLDTYDDLQKLHSDTLRCPCTSINILYQTFISLFPVFHQVCSSDFVTDQWLQILGNSYAFEINIDWRNRAFSQFQLLSNLCQFAEQTVNEAIRRFLVGSFVTLDVLPKIDFDKQINATLDEFVRSTTAYFALFVETTGLLMQIDQPFMGSIYNPSRQSDLNSPITPLTNEANALEIAQVNYMSIVRFLLFLLSQ